MAEATKKGSQSTGSTGGRGKSTASGATDPNPETANLGGASSTVTTSGTGSASTAGSMGTGSTGVGSPAGTTGSSTRTSGTHDMSADASQYGSGEGHGLMDQMRSSASDTFRTVKSNTTAKLEEQKSTLSTGLLTVADNIRQLGSNLSGGQQNDPLTRIAADYSETAAQKLSSAADYFNNHDIETMYRDVEGLARRNPAVFVGGAFALGFLAARFLKSSSPRQDRRYGSSMNAMTSGSTGSTAMPRLNMGGSTGATSM
jgi:hypothetical protein